MLTQELPLLTIPKIMRSIERNPTVTCDIFMGAIEWNLWNNDKSLTRLATALSCNKDVIEVFTALHNKLFNGLAIPMGLYNSYDHFNVNNLLHD